MNPKYTVAGLVLGGIVLVLLFTSLFTVQVTQQALILQFGSYVRTVREPGLHIKAPWQDVTYMDKRVLALDLAPQEVIASDEKRVVVDALVRFRINDPLQFYKTVQGDERIGRARLGTTVVSAMRRVLGSEDFNVLLTDRRSELMNRIRDLVGEGVKPLGVEIIDVRLKRADLPPEISQAIFERMQKNYNEQAAGRRASGMEEAQRIRAEADREKAVIIAEANRQAQILRGEGDGEAVKIFAESFGKDVNFFEFYRSMQAYRATIGKEDTLVLSPDSDFFKYIRDMNATGR
ncbi:protease modulator HflC [Iodidimonas sp. SYSU 1G8]|uniref:protease modulator HflC n=1 Tax=Iodidimonas sp. SYSU 1G8 TaxID=3133967 RepID=UPI0031FECC35